jgi:hypothetical protein
MAKLTMRAELVEELRKSQEILMAALYDGVWTPMRVHHQLSRNKQCFDRLQKVIRRERKLKKKRCKP